MNYLKIKIENLSTFLISLIIKIFKIYLTKINNNIYKYYYVK